jgi:hypothetical protein
VPSDAERETLTVNEARLSLEAPPQTWVCSSEKVPSLSGPTTNGAVENCFLVTPRFPTTSRGKSVATCECLNSLDNSRGLTTLESRRPRTWLAASPALEARGRSGQRSGVTVAASQPTEDQRFRRFEGTGARGWHIRACSRGQPKVMRSETIDRAAHVQYDPRLSTCVYTIVYMTSTEP